MTAKPHPYGDTRAAKLLRIAISRFTEGQPGGLRALAARLDIKQATVLSHMANGRMAIPLDRANQLAHVLDINPTEFSLAVLEQRAPDVYDQLNSVYPFEIPAAAEPVTAALAREIASASPLTDQQISLIKQLLRRKDPEIRWVVGAEAALVDLIRTRRPGGVVDHELKELLALVTNYLAK
ncbi:MAG: hypothetical protein NVS3B5_20640 [Sphingomicrobium sp.]